VAVVECEPGRQVFLDDVLHGLRQQRKCLPCKYLYDEAGSRLFDRICELDEYYLTRTELAVMQENARDVARRLGDRVLLVEYGSGSSVKTRLLLDHLAAPAGYVPVDISREHLEASAARLARAYPQVEVLAVCADFTGKFDLPEPSQQAAHTVVYFPGSTIGNFEPNDAAVVLRRIADLCGPGGGLLIGVDLKKDARTIEAAYNDSQGVTAEFNLNVLCRINRELGADFRVDRFRHSAVYSAPRGRVELGLVSRCRQSATVADEVFWFDEGEEIRTEYSHKYTVDEFREIAGRARWTLDTYWTDPERRFAVLYFVNPA
jgi:dimethylhistidine N-methyltransferase